MTCCGDINSEINIRDMVTPTWPTVSVLYPTQSQSRQYDIELYKEAVLLIESIFFERKQIQDHYIYYRQQI